MKLKQNCLIDLHLHLDGSISVSSARELADIEGVRLPRDDYRLESLLKVSDNCRNLNEYLEKFALPVQLMQSSKSIELAAYNLCRELRELGLVYAEIRFAPQKHCQRGLTQEGAVKAALNGIRASDFNAGLILCCMRDEANNSAENITTVGLTQKYLGNGVCACDLAGAEALFPNEKYKYVFDEARRLNVPFTVHSGEALGAQSVALALDLGAKRVGHGIRAIEDESVLNRLAEQKISLEICPTSNINTCVADKLAELPIKLLMDKGIIVTINSDNMSVSNTNVRIELQRVADAFDLNNADVCSLLINSAEAAFLPDELKESLKDIIKSEFNL